MDFLEDYPNLEPAQKERFQQIVTRLLSGEVLTPGPALKPDPDWRFVERFREIVDSYLRFGGWRLDIDLGLRLARAVHEVGAQRVRFTKAESLLLCMLRLFYHEQMQTVSDDEHCEIDVGSLRERLVHAGKPANQLSSRSLALSLRRLARYSLVEIARGFEGRDDELITVTPLIEKVLPPERIQDIEQKLQAYLSSRATDPDTTTGEIDAEDDGIELTEGAE